MRTYVIDASVAAKWLLPAGEEPLASESLQLLRRYSEGEVRFLVPDLFWAELANILWKSVRVGRLRQASAEAGLRATREQAFPTWPSRDLLVDAFAIASAFGRTVYDALYVALAVNSKSQLITADERLANALASHLPVKTLGSLDW